METFRQFVTGPYTTVPIDLEDRKWHVKAGIKPVPGWYYLTTNTPVEVLAAQSLWSATYSKKRSNDDAPVRGSAGIHVKSSKNSANHRI